MGKQISVYKFKHWHSMLKKFEKHTYILTRQHLKSFIQGTVATTKKTQQQHTHTHTHNDNNNAK